MFCNSDELVMNRFSFMFYKNKIQFHHDGGEPANERDEEAACRGPESAHVRVLLHSARKPEQRELRRLQPFIDRALEGRRLSGSRGARDRLSVNAVGH